MEGGERMARAKKAAEGPKEKKRVGAPPKYATPEALQEKLYAYFRDCDEQGKLYSEVGMALSLGVTLPCLDHWWRGDRCPELQDTIRMAYTRIAEQIATDPRYNERQMVSYRIFLLKQEKFGGYQDRVEAKNDLTVNVKMGSNMEESDFA